jgi:hypothetical protein
VTHLLKTVITHHASVIHECVMLENHDHSCRARRNSVIRNNKVVTTTMTVKGKKGKVRPRAGLEDSEGE